MKFKTKDYPYRYGSQMKVCDVWWDLLIMYLPFDEDISDYVFGCPPTDVSLSLTIEHNICTFCKKV